MNHSCSRRDLLLRTGAGVAGVGVFPGLRDGLAEAGAVPALASTSAQDERKDDEGHQRLSLVELRQWEALEYGMFIHFGMSTFVGDELPDGQAAPTTYAPDRLDVDQWISVARDAGMKYAVLTTKHVAGHCLWPSKHTTYTVANSTNQTDLCEKFVTACAKRGVQPGFYYCSWDNHNRFGSRTPSDVKNTWDLWPWEQYNFNQTAAKPPSPTGEIPAFTTSIYQGFQTAQITELLTQYGPIAEVWIDIPGVLGMGYRIFLYRRIAELQPDTVIMMNSGISSGETYNPEYAWPSDLISIERRLPPKTAHVKWRTINGKNYYLPGEVCDPIGKNWFFVPNDLPRTDEALIEQYQACRQRGVNLLLNVPPDKQGVIPAFHSEALMRLRRAVGL